MIEEIQKTQLGRINSILIFSPLMIYFATKNKLSDNERIILSIIGIGTFVSVYYAWNENRKKLNELKK